MRQLIDKAALVLEIKRKIRTEQGYSSGDAECGYRDCAREILSFINTLETKEVKEQPANRSLEEEFVSYVKEKFGIRQEGAVLKTDGLTISPYDFLDIAKYFAQWQKQRVADKACEWLEENIDKYIYITGEYDGYKMFEDFKNILKGL